MVATYESSIIEQMPAESVADRLVDLEQRLNKGLEIIDERASAGLAVDRYEEHWMSLLSEYERLYDSFRLTH